MNKRLLEALIVVSLVVLLSTLLAACGGREQQNGGQDTETLDGEALVQERCTRCHDLSRVTSASKTRDEWQATVEDMVSRGANLDAEEQAVVVEYLAETYP